MTMQSIADKNNNNMLEKQIILYVFSITMHNNAYITLFVV